MTTHELITYRYNYTLTQTTWTPWNASPSIYSGDDVDITYHLLQDEHKTRLIRENGTISEQVLRNQTSTLNQYLTFIGKSLDNRVGRELLGNFTAKTAEYLRAACSGNKRTGADKMSHLRAWKKTLDKLMSNGKRRSAEVSSPFHIELRRVIATCGELPKPLAHRIGISASAMQRWMAGAFPNTRTLPALRRLEAALDLHRGHLEDLLPRPEKAASIRPAVDSFARRLLRNTSDPYRIPLSSLGEPFRNEWIALLRYKTTEKPVGIKRIQRGVWRKLPRDKVNIDAAYIGWASPDTRHACASAVRCIQLCQSFFGYLERARDFDLSKGGLGHSSEDSQTLASMAVPEFVAGFFEFMKARSDGIVHGGHKVVAAMLQNLLNPDFGYLKQQPEFLTKIEKFAKGRSWDELCAETFSLCGYWKKAAGVTKSRDPKTPILALLRLESPLQPLLRAISDLDMAAAAAAPGSILQASLKRDALLLSVIVANPLRARTLTIAKYISDEFSGNAGELSTNLYQTEAGGWRLCFQKGDFKNDGSRNEDYDAPLPKRLNDRITDYLLEYRPVLIKNNPESPWLFPSGKSGDKLGNIAQIIKRIAKRYIPEVSRLGPHALRHIVASDFLSRNPGQYTVVAELLHDNLETVLRNYSHLKQEKSFKAHEEHLERVFAEM